MEKFHGCLFLTAHFRSFFIRFILESTQVQQSVGNYPEEFLLESNTEDARILANPLHTDINVAIEASTLHIVKRNNIRKRVVLEVLEVELQKIVIVAENVIHITQLFTVRLGQLGEPTLVCHLMRKLERGLRMEKYHIQKFRQKYRKKRKQGKGKRKNSVFLQPETGLVVQWIERKFPKL